MPARTKRTEGGDDQHERRRIQSVNVGFALIRHLATSPDSLSLKELSEASGMSASQVHMYMASFIVEGLAVQDPATARYDLGPYALELGLAAMRKLDVLEVARPAMLALRDEVGVSVFLTVWGNQGATIVSKVDANRRSPMVLRVGYVLPTLDSATGRLYLALLPEDATRHIVERERADPTFPPLTDAQIAAIIERTRRTGLGTHDESRTDGFTGIAVPLLDASGSIRAALTLTGPAQQFADGADGPLAAALRVTAAHINTRLGYRSPPTSLGESMERSAAQVIDDRPVGSFQVRIIVLSALVLILDGFDIGTISSTAKAISLGMHRSVTGFGPVFAAGFTGILAGALIFGTLADRFGRRKTVIAAALSFGVFTLLTPLVRSYPLLLWLRVLTGIGLGGAVPNAVALTSEYVPGRVRAFAVNCISAGIALGGFLAPVLSSRLLPQHGWKPVFVIGGIFPIVLAGVMAVALPESLRFLAVRNPADPLARKLLARIDPALGGASQGSDFTLAAERHERVSLAALFTRDRWVMTVLLSVMNFCTLTVALLMVSWLPTLLEAAGLSVTSSLLTASMFSAAGVAGTLFLGYTMVRRAPGAVLTSAFCCSAAGIVIFAFAGHSRTILAIALAVAGFFLFGCQAAVNAVASQVYPTAIRSTGVGWVLGSGRVGSIIGPFIAGAILTSLLHDGRLFIVVAIPALAGAAAALGAHRAMSRSRSIQEASDNVPRPADRV